jgi:hypothetical protein
MKMDPKWVALRSVEIHRAFSNSGSGQLAFLDIPNVMRIGQITRLANMLRKRGMVSYDSVKALGALLGMQPDTINSNLEIMHELLWIGLEKNSKGVPTSVEDHVPRLERVLDELGGIFSEAESAIAKVNQFSDVEKASLSVLHMCAKMPCNVEALISELNLDARKYQKILDLGRAARYLEPIKLADGKDALWSPIYYYNQYDNIKKFMQRQTISSLTPIGEAIELCAENVGIPLQKLPPEKKQAAIAGMRCGAILPLTLWMPTETGQTDYTFLFPPLSKFEDSNPAGDFLERSKVLLASFRLGENFAPTSKIRNSLEIIRKLKTEGKFLRPHSDAFDQYRVPASRGIFVLKEETGTTFFGGHEYKGWMPYLIKSEENMKALDIAESLVTPSSERLSSAFQEDVKAADNVFKQTLTCMESLEFRGSSVFNEKLVDPKLLRAAEHMALTIHGGTYE